MPIQNQKGVWWSFYLVMSFANTNNYKTQQSFFYLSINETSLQAFSIRLIE